MPGTAAVTHYHTGFCCMNCDCNEISAALNSDVRNCRAMQNASQLGRGFYRPPPAKLGKVFLTGDQREFQFLLV